VLTQSVSYRQVGMLEVIGRVVGHADFLHHSAGLPVCWNGEGNNLIKANCFERIAKHLGDISSPNTAAQITGTDSNYLKGSGTSRAINFALRIHF
jgi:hypothetical protein